MSKLRMVLVATGAFLLGFFGGMFLPGWLPKHRPPVAAQPGRPDGAQAATPGEPDTPEDSYVGMSVTKNNVELSVRIQDKRRAGHAVRLVVKLTNLGTKPITFAEKNGYGDFWTAVTDRFGKPIPLTTYGRFRIGGLGREQQAGRYIAHELKPGASFSVAFNLDRLYDLSDGGQRYLLTVGGKVNRDNPPEPIFDIELSDLEFRTIDDSPGVELIGVPGYGK